MRKSTSVTLVYSEFIFEKKIEKNHIAQENQKDLSRQTWTPDIQLLSVPERTHYDVEKK